MENKGSEYYNALPSGTKQVETSNENGQHDLRKLGEILARPQLMKQTAVANMQFEAERKNELSEDVSEEPASPSAQQESTFKRTIGDVKLTPQEHEEMSDEAKSLYILRELPSFDNDLFMNDETRLAASESKAVLEEDDSFEEDVVSLTLGGDEEDEEELDYDDDSFEEEDLYFDGDYLETAIGDIRQQLGELKQTFEMKIADTEFQEQTIQQLRAEIQSYKAFEKQEYTMPLVRQLIHLIDKYRLDLDIAQQREDHNLIRFYIDVIQDLHDTLFNYGIEVLKPLEKFDATRHVVYSVVETDQPELDRAVKKVRGYGYEWNGRLIRQENVVLYKYIQPVNGGANE